MYKKFYGYKQLSKVLFESEFGINTYELCFQPIHICLTKWGIKVSVGLLAFRIALSISIYEPISFDEQDLDNE